LQKKPSQRLGVINGGAKLIKKHAWFSNFDWDAFIAEEMTVPFKPKVTYIFFC